MTVRLTAVVLSLAAVALPAAAQNLKPGLYETTSKMNSGDNQMAKAMAEMQKMLADMPPEQRKAMEDMMAKRGGPRMTTGKDGSIGIKMCLTKQMIDDSQLASQNSGNCTQKKGPMVGGTMKFSFSCSNPPSSGEGTFKLVGNNAYTTSMKMTSSHNGKPQTMTVESSSRWLSADCGDVKPITYTPDGAPKAK